MKYFLLKFLKYALIVMLLHLSINFVFFFFYYDSLPQQRKTCVVFLDTARKKNKIAVISCSNGEHNLEFSEIRRSLPDNSIDFYIFNGNAHFNFINFLVYKKIFQPNKYSKVVLYLPYSVYDQSSTYPHRWGMYEIFASKDYLKYLINNAPYLLATESWLSNFIDLEQRKKHTKIKGSDSSYTTTFDSRTKYIDSLINNNTSYRAGNHKFISSKFDSPTEPDEIYQLKPSWKTKTFVFLPPMPNTAHNLQFKLSKKQTTGFEVLNSYQNSIKDSTLFYDQWWHLNFKGRQIETNEFIKSVLNSN